MKLTSLAGELVETHEGRRHTIYYCTEGHPTIGVGHRLDGRPLTDAEIDLIFATDLGEAVEAAKEYEYFNQLCAARQVALIDMAFQLGRAGLKKFKKMHAALADENYVVAAAECLDSLYAKQTPKRAWRIATILESGVMF